MDEFSAEGKFLTATLPVGISLCLSVHPQFKWCRIFKPLPPLPGVALLSEANSTVTVSFHISTKQFTWVVKHTVINDAP